MLPNQLVPESFGSYPAEAKRLAASHIALLQRLPLGFVPLLLRELIVYDWKFPAERSPAPTRQRKLNSAQTRSTPRSERRRGTAYGQSSAPYREKNRCASRPEILQALAHEGVFTTT